MKIFGYEWEEIKAAQQGARLRQLIQGSGQRPKATAKDFELLEKHGVEGLQREQMCGVLDRLGLPMISPTTSEPTEGKQP